MPCIFDNYVNLLSNEINCFFNNYSMVEIAKKKTQIF